jgi:TRAP-type C4-dicarboxylate transport system permease small subunit
MQSLLTGIEKMLDFISKVAISTAAMITLAIAVIGTVDVLTTNVIKQAVPGAVELSQAGLVLLAFFGLAVASRSGDHIKVDILTNRLPQRWQYICSSIGYLFTAVFFLFWTQQLWFLAKKSWSIGETVLGLFQFPLYPVKIAIFLAMTMATVETIRRFVFSVAAIFRKETGV